MIFDFDNSKTISKDELIIMIISFIRGIGCMTNSILYDAVDIEPLGKHCFEVVGIDIKKNVSLEDLTHWVSGLTEIVSLFSKHDKLEIIKKGKKIENHERRKSNTAAKTTRRGSITLGLAKITDNYRSRNQSKGITLEKPEWKNRQRDEKSFTKFFFKTLTAEAMHQLESSTNLLWKTNDLNAKLNFSFMSSILTLTQNLSTISL